MQPRRLLLIRHAPAARGPVDADRPLTGAGVGDAQAVGTWLARAELVPDRVLVSPARRAAQTWEIAAGQLASCPEPITDPRIYDNAVEQVLATVREAPDDALTLAVVGHNPSIRELAAALDDGRGSPEARRALDRGFPAAGVAVFVLPGSFAATAPGAATLTDFTVPGD
jgi:phosphohistidine phosphatase